MILVLYVFEKNMLSVHIFDSTQSNHPRKNVIGVLCIAGAATSNAVVIALKYINNKITMCGAVGTRIIGLDKRRF